MCLGIIKSSFIFRCFAIDLHSTGLLLHLDSPLMWKSGKWSFHVAEISKRLPEHSTWQVWSAFISIHIGKLLLRPQEWCLQLRFQCRQWENGDGKIIPHLVILFLVQVSKDGSWKVFDTAIQFSRGQDAEVNSGNCFECLTSEYLSKVLVTGSYPWDSNQPSLISLSPDGLVVAIAQVVYLNG